jgi:GNAT superfamily N-acetyltransferase
MSEVRRVMPQEWVTLRSIRLAALRDSPQSFCSGYEHEAGWDDHRWRESVRSVTWFLAWRDGRPVGIAGGTSSGAGSGGPEAGSSGGQRDEGTTGGEPAGERQVISMWVDPSARGTGIADALIGAVAGWARAEGAHTLKLWVADASPRARAFYQRARFRATGEAGQMPGDPGAKRQEFSLDLDA